MPDDDASAARVPFPDGGALALAPDAAPTRAQEPEASDPALAPAPAPAAPTEADRPILASPTVRGTLRAALVVSVAAHVVAFFLLAGPGRRLAASPNQPIEVELVQAEPEEPPKEDEAKAGAPEVQAEVEKPEPEKAPEQKPEEKPQEKTEQKQAEAQKPPLQEKPATQEPAKQDPVKQETSQAAPQQAEASQTQQNTAQAAPEQSAAAETPPADSQSPEAPAEEKPMPSPSGVFAQMQQTEEPAASWVDSPLMTLSNGYQTPASSAKLTEAEIAAFRRHLQGCWNAPAGLAGASRLMVVLRVGFSRTGALAGEPTLIAASASPKGAALIDTAKRALRGCQPVGVLPAEKYKEWKLLDLAFSPAGLTGLPDF
ncbi:hypothetical protein [Rhodovulum sp. PH10]|uniref:hypothetical protein n=1 Tax=Rhodovulum sp. PH10 TaxID=1187851 RepID=UPI0002DDD6AB|nr:hypothetical protein [Rhodovulum sp. PH10]